MKYKDDTMVDLFNLFRSMKSYFYVMILLVFLSGLNFLLFGCINKEKEAESKMHPAIVKQEFIYPIEKAPTPQCHASTIEESEGKLIAAWFGGTREKNKDVGIWVSRNEGRSWTVPLEVVNGEQEDGTRHPCWNPVLFQPTNGPLMLFYKIGPDPETWWGMLLISADGGVTWSAPQKLPETILGPIKNKPVELADGTLLCPSSREDAGWIVHVEITDGKAESWRSTDALNDPEEFEAIQPTILIYPQERLQILCRTANNVITQCWSEDKGLSWSRMTATTLPNPNSGIDAVTLKDGRQLLVYNPVAENWGDRVPLSIAVSTDGQSWKKVFDLEPVIHPDTTDDEEYSYPAVIQTHDRLIHVVYTYNRRTVKHVAIDPEKI
jgi:alpha-L-rhamnosidase